MSSSTQPAGGTGSGTSAVAVSPLTRTAQGWGQVQKQSLFGMMASKGLRTMVIAPGSQRHHVDTALEKLAAGVKHPFGRPTRYAVRYGDNQVTPKAVSGFAAMEAIGQVIGLDVIGSNQRNKHSPRDQTRSSIHLGDAVPPASSSQ